MLLRLLVHSLASPGLLVLGIDHTLERRRGVKIQAKSVYCEPCARLTTIWSEPQGCAG
jgi:hypothetical protein